MAWHATPGGIRDHGSRAKWSCYGCGVWDDFDLGEYLERVGPKFELWNELSICGCGAPRSLHVSPGPSTPFFPIKDEWLWVSKEIGYGVVEGTWFEIDFMVDSRLVTAKTRR